MVLEKETETISGLVDEYETVNDGIGVETLNDGVEIEIDSSYPDDTYSDDHLEIDVEYVSSEDLSNDDLDSDSDDNEILEAEPRTGRPLVDVILDDEVCPDTPAMSEDEDDQPSVQRNESENEGREFSVLQMFKDANEFKETVKDYSIKSHRPVRFARSNKERVSVKCKDKNCPWRIWCSIERRMQKFQIKTYEDQHTCLASNCNSLCDSRWLAKRFIDKFRRNNNYKATDLRADCLQMYGVTVSYHQCFRARQKALRRIQGNQAEHFARLRSYQNVLNTNRGSTVIIKTDESTPGKPIFRRMYVCFDALRRGWTAGCRPIIGLDGAFLKWFVKGELLSAVGRDANNQMFPIAWAVVEVENIDSWTWFITLLSEDLALGTGAGFTMVTDGQKGLLRAIKDVLPNASHRNCARHIYANWRKIWKQRELKPLFWAVARAYTVSLKDEALAEVKKFSHGAVRDLEKNNMDSWCRAYFTETAVCDVVHNNMSESFNSSIRGARSKPIINMLEQIRIAVMERMASRIETISKWTGDITPKAEMEIQKNLEKSHFATVIPNGRHKWEVHSGDDACVVDMELKTCSCREWSLSGIPCYHSLAVISRIKGEITDNISPYYSRVLWEKTYEHVLNPINGVRMWPKSDAAPIQPPRGRKMPGRPKRNRVKDRHESPQKKRNVATRHGRIMTCTHCHYPGHNKSTCLKRKNGEPPVEQQSFPLTKTGRPSTEDNGQASTSTKRPRKPNRNNAPAAWNMTKDKTIQQESEEPTI